MWETLCETAQGQRSWGHHGEEVGSQGAQVHLHQYTHCQDDTANELAIRGAPSSHGHNLTH